MKRLLWGMGTLLLVGCQGGLLAQPTPTPIQTDQGPDECQDGIKVEVWDDQDGDGVFDEDETPLANVLLIMARGDDPTDNVQSHTNDEGYTYFAGFEAEGCQWRDYNILFARQVRGYQMPDYPLAKLETFDADREVIGFGLIAEQQ